MSGPCIAPASSEASPLLGTPPPSVAVGSPEIQQQPPAGPVAPKETKAAMAQIQYGVTYAPPTYLGCFKRSPHIRCIIFTVLPWLFVGFLLVLVLPNSGIPTISQWLADLNANWNLDRYHSTLIPVFGALSGLFVLVYYVECFLCSTFRYLRHLDTHEGVADYINRIKSTPPRLLFSCECYHYEQRQRTVSKTVTDSNGQTHTEYETEYYTEKVTTYTGCEDFAFNNWSDLSGFLTDEILRHRVLKIEMSKEWSCADSQTQMMFERAKEAFDNANRWRDSDYWSGTSFEIPGFVSKKMSVMSEKSKPALLDMGAYVLFSFFFLSWPYRMWLEMISTQSFFTFHKSIKCY